MESLGELKEYLKIFVKEKEQAYRVKIEKKLYGRHYNSGEPLSLPEKKRSRKEYEDDDYDDENYVYNKKRSSNQRKSGPGRPKRRLV